MNPGEAVEGRDGGSGCLLFAICENSRDFGVGQWNCFDVVDSCRHLIDRGKVQIVFTEICNAEKHFLQYIAAGRREV
jgi:hypothetical protein